MSPDQVLLCIYTLFHVEGSQHDRVRSIVEELTGQPLIDYKVTLAGLKTRGYLVERGYNWRTDSYDYDVAPDRLIPLMIHFYEEEPENTVRVMEAARRMVPSSVQRLLWRFISSGYEGIRIEEISDYEIGERIDSFLPAVEDKRFLPLLLVFTSRNLHDLLMLALQRAFEEEKEDFDTAHLRYVVRCYKTDTAEAATALHHVVCLADLLDYLARGTMPRYLEPADTSHLVMAAIRAAYQGDMKRAMANFKRAVALSNRTDGFYTSTKSYLPLSIQNFFYVLACSRADTDESGKRALAISKSAEPHVTAAAKVLYNILYGSATDRQIFDRLNMLLADRRGINRSLATLMCCYVGGDFSCNVEPRWSILRHEMSAFVDGIQSVAAENKPYGAEPMLASIQHRKQFAVRPPLAPTCWLARARNLPEGETPSLGRVRGGVTLNSQFGGTKEVRIGYFLRSMKAGEATPRLQTTLKNGGWGAGKQIGMQNYLGGSCTEGMAEADQRILERERADRARRQYAAASGIRIENILTEMTGESRLYVGRYAPYSLVEVIEEKPYITLHHDREGFLINSNVKPSEVEQEIIITHRGATSINFIRLTDAQRPYYRRLLRIDRFPNEAEPQLRRFLAGIGGKIEIHSDLIEGGSTLPICDGDSKIVVQMRPDRNTRRGESFYNVSVFVRPLHGGRIRCVPGDGNEVIIDNGIVNADDEETYVRTRVKRNLDRERENLRDLTDSLREEVPEVSEIVLAQDANLSSFFLLPLIEYAQANPERITCEWPEGARMRIKQRNSSVKWNGSISKKENGWFELEGSVELDQDKVISMARLLELARQSRGRFVPLGGGDFLALSQQLRRQLDQLGTLMSRHHGRLQMSPFTAALLEPDLMNGELQLEEDEELTEIRRRIKESSTYTPEVPPALHATLRQYQKEGYQWMSRLNYWGAGALLADDMGLGKTIQTITFLLSKAEEGPALVIAPASVAPNWQTEFEKFAPSLHVSLLNFESDRHETIRRAKAGDVVVCTYMLLLSVKEDITSKQWNTICLDEAHIIKNRGAKTSAVAMKLKSRNRIMLTGTPVQNHLGELWNLFQFVNPGLLGSFEDFNRRFIIPIEQNNDTAVQHQLDRLVKPFMLRRTKDKVARELPEKEEIYQHVTLTEEEQLAYEAMRQRAEALLLAGGLERVSMNTLAEITRLRLAACSQSKVTALLELLQTIIDGNGNDNAVLVFSQFTTYLAQIQKALQEAHIPYLYIDGTVPITQRQQLVERFQKGECPVFLISLKAGGLGLNLTRANYVIHMDPWWNPAIEAQATDRSHRIGQSRAVTVYHLISQGTIEEKIQRLHERKQNLATGVLAATDMSYKLTGEELLQMVRGE